MCFLCAAVLHRSGGFFSKILKKRPHKEAQTPDNGELTLAQILNERPTAGEGKQHQHGDCSVCLCRVSGWFY